MRRFLFPVSLFIVFGTVWFASRQTPAVSAEWNGDLAVITWKETLADPKAQMGETPFSLLSGPYINWLSPTMATIGWEVIAEKTLTRAPYASLSKDYPVNNSAFRSTTLTDLKPNTVYRYRLASEGQGYKFQSKDFTFRTLPPADTKTFRFAAIGDTQMGQKPEIDLLERNLFGMIADWKPALLLHLGDMLPTGRGDGHSIHESWFRAQERNNALRANFFMAATSGNHCWSGKGHGWYADYFGNMPVDADGAKPPFYYSFDVGSNVHFVCLNTEVEKSNKDKNLADQRLKDLPFSYNDQLAWLDKDLARTKATWKVVFFHKPLHTVGPYPASEAFRKDVGALCDKYGVQVLLSGHDHSYQKTWRINNVTRERSDTGTVQVVSGGGGGSLFNRKLEADWNIDHVKVYHYVRVEVDADELRVQAVDAKNHVFDAWRLKATGQPEKLN
jgi:acid phosphatase type 7